MRTLAFIFLASSMLATSQTNDLKNITTTIDGSVFIVMKSGQNVKLALAPISVMSKSKFLEISKTALPILEKKAKAAAIDYVRDESRKNYRGQLDTLEEIQSFRERIYFDLFPAPVAKSDADGKFNLTFTDLEPKIIACRSQRLVSDKAEKYFWVIGFNPTGKHERIMFCNDNMEDGKNILSSGDGFFLAEVKKLEDENSRNAKLESHRRVELQRKAAFEAAERAREKTALSSMRAMQFNLDAAAKGDAYGQLRMGERYLAGDGVEKDEAKAKAFLSKSAAQGNASAIRLLEKLK